MQDGNQTRRERGDPSNNSEYVASPTNAGAETDPFYIEPGMTAGTFFAAFYRRLMRRSSKLELISSK
jgi:hypothetical protein